MAAIHGKSAAHTVNAANLATGTKSVSVKQDAALADTTSFGSAATTYTPGVPSSTMDAEYNWDPAAAQNDVTTWNMINGGTSATVDVTPGGGAASATNPKYSATAYVASREISIPFDGLVTMTCSFQNSGALSRVTA